MKVKLKKESRSIIQVRQSVEHYRCIYFKHNRNWKGDGVVVEKSGNKALLMIPELAMITQIKPKTEVELEDKIKLKVSSINLFERSIDFKPL